MKLRQWQSECISQALVKYSNNENHFLCLATPGAGKTVMAATLANQLIKTAKVDLVLCLSPSIIVSQDFKSALEEITNFQMDGQMGSKGKSLTYQSMLHLDDSFWKLFDNHKVFVIFDEIHHCAGQELENANAWGQKIIQHIQGRATYTLALTGTPWRSDRIPIVLSSYCKENKIYCDYMYGLPRAIQDNVCRIPKITLIDNDQILVNTNGDFKKYSSFADLLSLSRCSYQQLVENETLISYFLKAASKKLDTLRVKYPDAGGLIVAASVEHARKIEQILFESLNENARIATYQEDDAKDTINKFKASNEKWIISVGMISEGTNIPRLRVCCHLTRIKTELHFRQLLGRILRVTSEDRGDGFLFVPAEPNLKDYANRVIQEIPDSTAIRTEMMPNKKNEASVTIHGNLEHQEIDIKFDLETTTQLADEPIRKLLSEVSSLARTYDARVNIFGQFKNELLKLSLTNNVA